MSRQLLSRIAEAIERLGPQSPDIPDLSACDAFVWHVEPERLDPIPVVNRIDLDLLVGIDRARDTLLANTRQFANGHSANNALVWGARGMGKSSLVKAVHKVVSAGSPLCLIEIQREDLPSIGRLMHLLRWLGTTDPVVLR